jgi:hypothetical protein
MSEFDDTSNCTCSLQEQKEYDTTSWKKDMSQSECATQKVMVVSKVIPVDYYYEMSNPIGVFTDEALMSLFIKEKRKNASKSDKFEVKTLILNNF